MIGLAVVSLLVLSAVGSFLWARPSKTDLRRASIRDEAMKMGLSLTTMSVPDTSERGRIEHQTRLVTGYKLRTTRAERVAPFKALRSAGEAGFGLPAGWVWQDPAYRATAPLLTNLLPVLDELPSWVELLGVLPDGVVIVIEERPSANAEIPVLHEQLTAAADRLFGA